MIPKHHPIGHRDGRSKVQAHLFVQSRESIALLIHLQCCQCCSKSFEIEEFLTGLLLADIDRSVMNILPRLATPILTRGVDCPMIPIADQNACPT